MRSGISSTTTDAAIVTANTTTTTGTLASTTSHSTTSQGDGSADTAAADGDDNGNGNGNVTAHCLTETDETCQCFLRRALFLPPGIVDAALNIHNNEDDEQHRTSKK